MEKNSVLPLKMVLTHAVVPIHLGGFSMTTVTFVIHFFFYFYLTSNNDE